MNSNLKPRGIITYSTLLIFLLSLTPRLNAQGFPPLRPHSERVILKAAKKTLPAIVHLEVGVKKEFPDQIASLPYYAFLNPPNRVNGDLKDLLGSRLGTGIMIDSHGHILTNAFLVNGARIIRICLHNGEWLNAKLIGSDPRTDLAILKIKRAAPFPYILPGNSDKIAMGDQVIAIGYHDAFKPTLTEGIICAKHNKAVSEPSTYGDFLQTDAWIDLNNSGGPLINFKGETIGVNDALLTRLSKLQGIGFAVPWNMALHVANQLIAKGKVEHGWLGLRIQDVILRTDLAKKGYIKGTMVLDVIENSPAQKAGLMPGDIIITYQGHRIYNSLLLKRLVSITPLGETVKMGILRHGHKKEISVQIGLQNDEKLTHLQNLEEYLGVSVTSFSTSVVKTNKPREGVIISWIDPNGPMGRAGFEANDIILEANGHPIFKQNDLKHVLETLNTRRYIIFLAIDHRTHRTGYVQVRVK